MRNFQYRHFSYLLLISGILFLLSSCSSTGPVEAIAQSFTSLHGRSFPMPQTQTSCPTASSARGAVMTPLFTGLTQNLVYTYTTHAVSFLKRYNINTGQKTIIARLPTITDAQISWDGHFVLFIAQVEHHSALQMVRMDGLGLQTLYCAASMDTTIQHILWSPDQQTVAISSLTSLGAQSFSSIQLLNLRLSTIHTLLAPTNHHSFLLRNWYNNTQIYMTAYTDNATQSLHNVYLLDTRTNDIKQIALIDGSNWDMCLAPDGSNLLLSQSGEIPTAGGLPQPPSIISAQTFGGGPLRILYASHVHAVTQISAVLDHMLLFVIGGNGSDQQAGLWKMNMDGSGLTLLTSAGQTLATNNSPWSSVSRDGRFYAVVGYHYPAHPTINPAQTALYYGSLHSAQSIKVALTAPGEALNIVGWTII